VEDLEERDHDGDLDTRRKEWQGNLLRRCRGIRAVPEELHRERGGEHEWNGTEGRVQRTTAGGEE